MRRRERVFKQRRARETYEAILAAAAKVFPKHGFDKTQTPDIAEAAGVSTGAVYRYFEDKREVFLEMLDDRLSAARADVTEELRLERFVGLDPSDAIEELVSVLFAQAKKQPALTRIFFAMSLTDPDVAKLRAEADAADRAALASLIAAVVPAKRVPNPTAAAFVVQTATIATATQLVLYRPRDVDEEAVRAALAAAVRRYLFG